jgi:hypothetical protein
VLDCEKPNEPSRRTATEERKAIVSFFMVDASYAGQRRHAKTVDTFAKARKT